MDHGKAFEVLLTNLSKAFDSLPHSLFNAKLKADGFDNNSPKLVNDYLSHNFQATKISNEYRNKYKMNIRNNIKCSAGFYIRIAFL